MSNTLKDERRLSGTQYIATANEIYVDTMGFVSRLSAKYGRILSAGIVALAQEVVDNAVKAYDAYPSDDIKRALREEYLVRAKNSLRALNNQLGTCYQILRKNPQGCFVNEQKEPLTEAEALRKLENLATDLGCEIDKETNLLKNAISHNSKVNTPDEEAE